MSDQRSIEAFESTLEQAHERLEAAEEEVDEFGKERLEELREAYTEFTGLLDRYEDQVVGDAGDYQTNIEFQSQIADVIGNFSKNMLLYETFVECGDHLKQKWFKTSHFEHVREQLEPVSDLVERLEEFDDARDAYREARRDLVSERRAVVERIRELEHLSRLANADLDAPTAQLREPIETYNDAVRDAFAEFKRERPTREILEFLDAMEAYPLIEFESPPEELLSYVQSSPPGEESIPTVLDYAEYSRSKLDHYVDDPDQLKHVVGGHRAYLSGLDAEPLCIGWPPPSETALQWRCRELVAAVNRIDREVVEHVRAVEALPRQLDYERLRTSAQARTELTEQERERIRAGGIEDELETLRQKRDRLEELLETYPDL